MQPWFNWELCAGFVTGSLAVMAGIFRSMARREKERADFLAAMSNDKESVFHRECQKWESEKARLEAQVERASAILEKRTREPQAVAARVAEHLKQSQDHLNEAVHALRGIRAPEPSSPPAEYLDAQRDFMLNVWKNNGAKP